jgi:hypothetical protein
MGSGKKEGERNSFNELKKVSGNSEVWKPAEVFRL